MAELQIHFEKLSPLQLYGVNDKNLALINVVYPDIKLVARGNSIKLIGEEDEINELEKRIQQIITHVEKYGTISDKGIENFLTNNHAHLLKGEEGGDIILYGASGNPIKARTANQQKLVESCYKHDMVFAIGPAGSGKTYTAVALAVRALKNKEVKKIILTRPAVEAGEHLGFLPGDLKEKLDPYLQPLYDALKEMILPDKLKLYIESEIIQIAPLAFMRGRTLDNAFVILDEAQNTTNSQIKMFLTRMGRSAKFIITGDITQIDLPKSQGSGLIQAVNILKDVEGLDFIYLTGSDIIRHPLVKRIIETYDKEEN